MNIFLYYMVLGIASVFNTVEIFAQELATTRGSLGCVATAIGSSGGFTITQPGKYCLTQNVTVSSSGVNGITITANNVGLDLNGFTISGPGGLGTGNMISVSGASNVRISNGTVRSAQRSGIVLTNASGVILDAIIAIDNSYAGFELVSSSTCTIKNCSALNATSASDVFGFTTTAGTNNTFNSCITNGISTTSSTFGDQATGIRIANTATGSSVVNCMVCDTTATNINAQPFGIRMQPSDPTLTLMTEFSINRDTIINDLAWSPDGKFLAIANVDFDGNTANLIDIFEFSDGRYRLLYSTPHVSGVGARAVSWSPDGRYLAVGTAVNPATGEVGVYEFDGVRLSASPLAIIELNNQVNTVDWAPNGRYIAVGHTGTFSVRVLRFSALGTPTLTLMDSYEHGAEIVSVHWSYNGRYLAIGGFLGSDTLTSSKVRILEFLYDNAVPGSDKLEKIFDIDIGTSPQDSGAVRWSPNGQYLAVGRGGSSTSSLFTLQVYEFSGSSAALVATSVTPVGVSARKIRWSQDGRYIFSGSATSDTTGRIDAMRFTGIGITPLTSAIPSRNVQALDISPDGTLIIAGTFESSGTVEEIFTYSGLGFATNCVINNNMVSNTAGASTGQAGANNGFGIVASTAQNQVTNNSCFKNDLNYAFSINVFEQFIANLKASTPLPFANFAFPTP